jgi:hypothetical protein
METVVIKNSKKAAIIDNICRGKGLVITDDENLCKAAAAEGLQVLPYK